MLRQTRAILRSRTLSNRAGRSTWLWPIHSKRTTRGKHHLTPGPRHEATPRSPRHPILGALRRILGGHLVLGIRVRVSRTHRSHGAARHLPHETRGNRLDVRWRGQRAATQSLERILATPGGEGERGSAEKLPQTLALGGQPGAGRCHEGLAVLGDVPVYYTAGPDAGLGWRKMGIPIHPTERWQGGKGPKLLATFQARAREEERGDSPTCYRRESRP
mmetsp:Transcript_11030/g.68050  ORF Transcript_11030/g.68050 Transcript_11030/m.68050 type:complete len:218 (-) Transcript_11030:1114-1767(-)